MSRGYSWLVRRVLDLPFHDTETGYKFFRREHGAAAAERDRGPGLVLGHGVHGPRRPARALGGGGPWRLRAARGQDLDRQRHARQPAILPAAAGLPPRPGTAHAGEGARRDRARRAARFGFYTLAMVPYRRCWCPSCAHRTCACSGPASGAGRSSTTCASSTSTAAACAGLAIGDECFVGDECLLDLAEAITLGRQVTLAERVLVLTHMNVGYADHPLQATSRRWPGPCAIEEGAFLGANVTVLAGVTIGAARSWRRAAWSRRTSRRARWSPACLHAIRDIG